DHALPDHATVDHALPDHALPDQPLPDQPLPFQVPPDHAEPSDSAVAMLALLKAWAKMSCSPVRSTPLALSTTEPRDPCRVPVPTEGGQVCGGELLPPR